MFQIRIGEGVNDMSKAKIDTLFAMVEEQPDPVQDIILNKVREIIEEQRAETEWDRLLNSTTDALDRWGGEIESEISAGLSEPFDYKRL